MSSLFPRRRNRRVERFAKGGDTVVMRRFPKHLHPVDATKGFLLPPDHATLSARKVVESQTIEFVRN